MAFAAYYYIRRFLLALSIVMLQDFLVGQFFIFVMSTIFQVIFIGLVKPYKNELQNKSERNSEVITMFIMYHIFCFTDWVSDPEIRNGLGYSCLFIVAAHISFHIFGILIDTFSSLKTKLRINYALYKFNCKGRNEIKQKFKNTGKLYGIRRKEARDLKMLKKKLPAGNKTKIAQ